MLITNFVVRKLDNTSGKLDAAKKVWANKDFIPSGDYWVAAFDVDGEKRYAGVCRGRRVDVADNVDQFDFQLRVNEEEFDADVFIPESEAAEILKAVSEEFMEGEYWNRQ
jgi:hypothetical protein